MVKNILKFLDQRLTLFSSPKNGPKNMLENLQGIFVDYKLTNFEAIYGTYS